MKYIDLHVHSNASDGTLSPKEVVDLAVDAGLSAIALTDHDTLYGISEALETADNWKRLGKVIQVIPGVELSVSYKNKDVHILGLCLDPNNESLQKELDLAQKNRDLRNEKMAENLQKAGIPISMKVLRQTEGDAVITRAHFAKYLTEQGITKNTKEAFSIYLNSESPYYVKREYLSPELGIKLIHEAKGVAVLAHPLLYLLNLEEVEELVAYLCDFGLDGIEAIYSLNKGFEEGHVRRIANKYGLKISGGSDFHGTNKPDIKIGKGLGNLKIPYSVLKSLKEGR